MKIDDAELLKALRNPTTRMEAFEQLYMALFPAIKKYAYYFTNDLDTAGDIAQDVFENFFNDKPFLLIDIRSFAALLMKSCKNMCFNNHKRLQRKGHHNKKILEQSSIYTEPNTLSGDAYRLLAALPPKQQQAVRLAVLNDLTQSEAARVMGLSITAFRFHLKNALTSLANMHDSTSNG